MEDLDRRYLELYQGATPTGRHPTPSELMISRCLAAAHREGFSLHALAEHAGKAHNYYLRKLKGTRSMSLADCDEVARLTAADLLQPVLLPGDGDALNAVRAATLYDTDGEPAAALPTAKAERALGPVTYWRLRSQDLVRLQGQHVVLAPLAIDLLNPTTIHEI